VRGPRTLTALCIAALLTLAAAVPASATEESREEYVAQVEPICRTNTKANERILAGTKAEVRHGHLEEAAGKLAAAGQALRATLRELRAVRQPRADRPRLGAWLGYVKKVAELFSVAAHQLDSGQKYAAEKTVVRLNNNATLADNKVLEFEFAYCRFEPARFL
jgi:hypothetical protein